MKAWVSSNRLLILILLLALSIRIAVALTREMIGGDENVYSHMADNLARGRGPLDMLGRPSTIFMPFLPLLMAALSLVLGSVVLSGYAIEIAAGCLLLIPVYLLGRDMVSRSAGLRAAALVAVLPLSVAFSTRIYTENLYALFLLCAAWAAWRGLRDGRLAYAATVGLFIGMAYLTNPAAIFYVVAASLFLLTSAIRMRGQRVRYLKAAAATIVIFMVFALPFIIFLHGELGKWTYTGKNAFGNISAAASNLRLVTPEYEKEMMVLTEDGTEVLDMARHDESPDPITFLVKNPRLALRIVATNTSIFYREELREVFPLWLLPLLGLGLFGYAWDRRRAVAAGYTLLLLTPLAVIFAIDYRARFFTPYMPLMMIWVALGWQRLEDWGRETAAIIGRDKMRDRVGRWLPPLLVLMVMAPLMLQTAAEARKEGYRLEYRDAGEWIRANAGPDRLVMDREFSAAYYSGGTAVIFPYADYEALTDYARYKQVDFMVIGKQSMRDWRPDLVGFLDQEGKHPDWQLVHTERPGTAQEILIFELLQKGSG